MLVRVQSWAPPTEIRVRSQLFVDVSKKPLKAYKTKVFSGFFIVSVFVVVRFCLSLPVSKRYIFRYTR